VSDDFRSLSPRERVDVVERDAAAIARPLDEYRLSKATRGWLEVVKLAIADDALSGEKRDEVRDSFVRHLDALPEADADAAENELRGFVALLNGRLGLSDFEDASENGDEPES
jgi:hypothetical protein